MKKSKGFTLVEILIVIGITATLFVVGVGFYVNQQKAKMFGCGDSVTFTYKGSVVTYGTVESQGKCWLDRNLGASRVATAYNDSQAYGDLFQWGRLDDSHQDRSSATTTATSVTDNPGHSNFIYGMGDPYDWRDPQNDNLWQGDGAINDPCPDGWRVPTSAEWDTERASWSSRNYDGAFASPLKLTAAGIRVYSDAEEFGVVWAVGGGGYYWSSSVHGTNTSYYLSFGGSGTSMYISGRASGISVRCIKD